MFKKPNQSTVVNAAISVGGGVAGSMASRIVVEQILGGETAADASTSNKRKMVKGGVAIASVILAASVTGKDKVSLVAQGAFVGMAVTQTLETIKEFAVENKNSSTNEPDSTVKRILETGLGLGCACDSAKLNYTMPTYSMPALQYPGSTAPYISAGYNAMESSKKIVFGQKKVII